MSDGDLREGETIAHYTVGRRLGGGGMGVVHEAMDESLERKVALKVIDPALAQDPDFRARFTREAQAQASLSPADKAMMAADPEAAAMDAKMRAYCRANPKASSSEAAMKAMQ